MRPKRPVSYTKWSIFAGGGKESRRPTWYWLPHVASMYPGSFLVECLFFIACSSLPSADKSFVLRRRVSIECSAIGVGGWVGYCTVRQRHS